jgi:hypothetical protein
MRFTTLPVLALLCLLAAAPAAAQSVERISVEQAAARIRAARGATVVVLYNTRCSLSRAMFPSLVSLARRHATGVTFLVYSVDREQNLASLPAYLQKESAPFRPVYIEPWPRGGLIKAMTPLGITVNDQWTTPLVAVLDGRGQVLAQGQGVTDVSGLAQVLATAR